MHTETTRIHTSQNGYSKNKKRKKMIPLNPGKDAAKQDCSCIAGVNVKWHSHSRKLFGGHFLNRKWVYCMTRQLYS